MVLQERIVVEWSGERWARYPESDDRSKRVYYQSLRRRKYLHVAVWEDANGRPCPRGHHIHHRDGNPLDNAPENLEALTPAAHVASHQALGDYDWHHSPEWLDHLARIRPSASEWHSSPEGRAWHSEHGRRTWEGRQPVTERPCEQCGEWFAPMWDHARWCSKVCRERWHYAHQTHRKPATCEACGGEFLAEKPRVRFCSRECARAGKPDECAECGGEYQRKRPSHLYCGRACAQRARRRERQASGGP